MTHGDGSAPDKRTSYSLVFASAETTPRSRFFRARSSRVSPGHGETGRRRDETTGRETIERSNGGRRGRGRSHYTTTVTYQYVTFVPVRLTRTYRSVTSRWFV